MFKRLTSEFLATFGLVLCGTGAIIIDQISGGGVSNRGIAISFGLIVMGMIMCFGHISGAHMNPAVSVGLYMAKRFNGKHVIPYILAQIAGAIMASMVLRSLFRQNESLGATSPRGSEIQSFGLEFMLTFLLMMVILISTQKKFSNLLLPSIAIGSTVGLEALLAGPISGASMNPSRSLAPAIVAGHFQSIWIYLSAPVLGAFFASLVFNLTITKQSQAETAA